MKSKTHVWLVAACTPDEKPIMSQACVFTSREAARKDAVAMNDLAIYDGDGHLIHRPRMSVFRIGIASIEKDQ